jgi:hypothetical protein
MTPHEVETVAAAEAELALLKADEKGSELVGAGAVGCELNMLATFPTTPPRTLCATGSAATRGITRDLPPLRGSR